MSTTGDAFDPRSVPIRPAATVMLVDDRPDLRVLMLRRTVQAVFASDMWVYPGGRVDPEDAAAVFDRVRGLDDEAASAALGIAEGGLAYWVAALRECFEEAGILLGVDRTTGAPVRFDDPVRRVAAEELRTGLNAGTVDFATVVDELDVVLDAAQVHYVAHWITPLGPPRRFDTRFFLAAAPPGQVPMHDDTEIVHHDWIAPGAGMVAWRGDAMAMMTPTARMLQCLEPFDVAADAVRAAAAAVEAHQVRVTRDLPRYEVLLPGDPGYDDGDPDTEFGWVKLRA